MSCDSGDPNDLAWPVTNGDCTILIAFSIAALVGIGSFGAWILGYIVLIP